jgi:hypothetical protein
VQLLEEDRLEAVPVAGLLQRFHTAGELTLHVKILPVRRQCFALACQFF